MMSLAQIAVAVDGQLNNVSAQDASDIMLNDVSINTRVDCQNALFVALNGDNFDAHDFLNKAEQAGSLAALVERSGLTLLPSVLVDDTHQALKALAAWWRTQFDLPLIGVTGSVGKTSVKEMLGVIFAQLGKGVVTQGNLNNEIGVPLTLMRLVKDDRYAIVEMGMNHAGEISRLTNIAKPNIALINNAAAAHLEGLGSIEGVAKAKGEIFEGLDDDGIAIINNDDDFAPYWQRIVIGKRVITFALNAQADVSATYTNQNNCLNLSVDAMGELFSMTLSALGEHSARNALAAIAASLAAGLSIEQIKTGLETYKPITGRLNLNQVGDALVIDDTYNASPLSMLAAIKVLVRYPNNTLIVGDMAELGSAAKKEHQCLGRIAAEHGVTRLLACGEFASIVVDSYKEALASSLVNAHAFTQQSDLIAWAEKTIKHGTILVKGSRSAKMEVVVNELTRTLQNAYASTGGSR